jgi:hypothetical protein
MEVPRLFMPDNNRIEQDHLAIRRRVRPMLGFQAVASARVILGGIEMIHMMRKQQAKYACFSAVITCEAVRSARHMSLSRCICPFLVPTPELRQNPLDRTPFVRRDAMKIRATRPRGLGRKPRDNRADSGAAASIIEVDVQPRGQRNGHWAATVACNPLA